MPRVDSLRNVGGQCMELYPQKPIYDIPAVPVYSSAELTENLLKQNHPSSRSITWRSRHEG